VAIVGGGPGGSSCAIHLAMQGISPVIIEREQFPRFHIGESLTGGSADLLRAMGLEEQMMARQHPIKYGIKIFGPTGRNPWWVPIRTRGADGRQEQRDTFSWQVRRSDFDQFLLDQALARGATLLRGRATMPLVAGDGTVRGVRVELADGSQLDLDSDVLVDASGQPTFLANAGLTGPKRRGRYARQVAIYAHFTGIQRDPGAEAGNTLTYFQRKHHWCWFIPLDEEVTSLGFVVPGEYFQSRNESRQDFLLRELREFHHELSSRTTDARMIDQVHATSNYSYEVSDFTGKGWLCIGDAHRFVDPLFSYGVNITMMEGREAARLVRRYLDGELPACDRPFQEFEGFAAKGVDVAQTFLDGFWDTTLQFGFLMREYQEDFVDLFAGRIWEDEEYPAVAQMRERLAAHYAQHPQDRPVDEPVPVR
jgi:flavin-dependent dehydrogenase